MIGPVHAPMRLAVREEGSMANAYWAPRETMAGAQLVACMSLDVLNANPEFADLYRKMLNVLAAELAKTRLGAKVVGIDVSDAPEHEKAGNA